MYQKLRRSLLGLALLTPLLWAPAAPAEVINEIILRVNNRFASLYDYLQARSDMRVDLLRSDLPEDERERRLAEVPQRVMRNLFQDMLLLSRADQLQVFVSDQQLQDELQRMRQDFGIQTDEEFARALQESGITEEKFRQQVRDSLMMREVLGREVQNKVDIDDEDLRRFYRDNEERFRIPEQRRAKEIVVLDSSDLDLTARKLLADQIYEQLSGGGSLAAVVDENAGAGRTSDVIHLDWISPGDLDEKLEAALWSLQPGQFSPPVEARGGLHILQLQDVKESQLRPFEEVKDWIRNREQTRVYNEKLSKYLQDLEKTAYIVEHVPADAAGYRTGPVGPLYEDPFKIHGEDEYGRPLPDKPPAPAKDESGGDEEKPEPVEI